MADEITAEQAFRKAVDPFVFKEDGTHTATDDQLLDIFFALSRIVQELKDLLLKQTERIDDLQSIVRDGDAFDDLSKRLDALEDAKSPERNVDTTAEKVSDIEHILQDGETIDEIHRRLSISDERMTEFYKKVETLKEQMRVTDCDNAISFGDIGNEEDDLSRRIEAIEGIFETAREIGVAVKVEPKPEIRCAGCNSLVLLGSGRKSKEGVFFCSNQCEVDVEKSTVKELKYDPTWIETLNRIASGKQPWITRDVYEIKAFLKQEHGEK